MAQFGNYNNKQLTEMVEEMYENLVENGVNESFDMKILSDIHVRITNNQLSIDGKQLINGNEYQPVKDRIRRSDNEDLFEALVISYLMMKAFGEEGKE